MNIGRAAELAGLPAKTIRYYEDVDLVRPDRRANGYRDYSEADVHKLRFLQRARGLGFSLEDCRRLLTLWEDRGRASADVRSLAKSHLKEIDRKLRELQDLRATLDHLVDACRGDSRPDCPIIDELAGR